MSSCISWNWTAPPIDRTIVSSVERALGVQFPESFVACIVTNHGGYPSANVFDFPGHKGAVFSNLLRFTEDQGEGDPGILDTYRSIRSRMPQDVIPFGCDPFGNYICFDFRIKLKGEPAIVFWDHEEAHVESDVPTSLICKSFADFLTLLYSSDD